MYKDLVKMLETKQIEVQGNHNASIGEYKDDSEMLKVSLKEAEYSLLEAQRGFEKALYDVQKDHQSCNSELAKEVKNLQSELRGKDMMLDALSRQIEVKSIELETVDKDKEVLIRQMHEVEMRMKAMMNTHSARELRRLEELVAKTDSSLQDSRKLLAHAETKIEEQNKDIAKLKANKASKLKLELENTKHALRKIMSERNTMIEDTQKVANKLAKRLGEVEAISQSQDKDDSLNNQDTQFVEVSAQKAEVQARLEELRNLKDMMEANRKDIDEIIPVTQPGEEVDETLKELDVDDTFSSTPTRSFISTSPLLSPLRSLRSLKSGASSDSMSNDGLKEERPSVSSFSPRKMVKKHTDGSLGAIASMLLGVDRYQRKEGDSNTKKSEDSSQSSPTA
jgi:chromosome segregation ATPase